MFVGPDALDTPLTFEGTRAIGATLGSGVVMVFDETADMVGTLRRIAAFFRDESCGQCVPCRVGTVRQEELLARLADRVEVRTRDEELRPARRHRAGDARRVHLRARPDGVVGDRVGDAPAGAGGAVMRIDGRPMTPRPAPRPPRPDLPPPGIVYTTPPARATTTPEAPRRELPPNVSLQIDGVAVSVPAGSTILDACRAQGLDIPTLCYLENLTPVNVCRVCVVEVKGSRVLAPACSRKVEEGMEVQTESERVQHSRKVVLEFLGSSVDLSLAGPQVPERRRRPLRRALRRGPGPVRRRRRVPRPPTSGTIATRAITTRRTATRRRSPRPSRSR